MTSSSPNIKYPAGTFAGHAETAIALLRKGVPLMMPNKNGAICLHMAAQHGHVSVVKSLLAKGAAVDAKTKVPKRSTTEKTT